MIILKTNNNEDKTNNNKIKEFSTREMIFLVIISLLIGLTIGIYFNKNKIINNNNYYTDEALSEFVKNYNYILDNYYEDIDKEKLINSAISGMMNVLDEHSVYIDSESTSNFSITLDGSYEGLGLQIVKDEETGYMLITSIFENSPASIAGLMPGDYIVSVDDKNSSDLTSTEFSKLILESESNEYNIKILRDNEEQNIAVKKNKVTLASVKSDIYERNNKKIGYIYIGIFANNTYEQFKEELDKLEKEKITDLIIDVRSNTGGHLTSVDSILDLFLNNKQIKYQFEQNGKKTKIYSEKNNNKKYNIILLGNEASASASEVLISSLKENLKAIFIGKKTYGKGTVQQLVELKDGTQYKITIKKWLTPNGNWINETKGIEPDVEVELDSKYYETYDDLDDTQLQTAINYICEEE
ncbi:MAG: S41 family peptidase [bacterium]|nr:S41 family peptidase [bacterium]